jgi:hypothetical protein
VCVCVCVCVCSLALTAFKMVAMASQKVSIEAKETYC